VVLGNARPYDRFIAAPQNTLFIAGEPLAKKLYPQAFYDSSAMSSTATRNRATRICT